MSITDLGQAGATCGRANARRLVARLYQPNRPVPRLTYSEDICNHFRG
jgi:hypothetical protein